MILEILFLAFIGYIVGRIGDYFAGHWDFFHHWVYGAILLVIALLFNYNLYLFYLGFFGLGLIISDFDDLLHLRIYGPDKKISNRFWGFD
jgi:hypothetical protein